MVTTGSISVLIVDDHPLVRVGMSTVISQQTDMRVTGMAETGAEALNAFRTHRPDVVLMDLRLRGDNGVHVTKALCDEFVIARVLMISNYEGDENIHQALAAGAAGYVFKSVVEDELVDAIREVHAGHRYLPRGVAQRLEEAQLKPQLTAREVEILGLLAKGLRNSELGKVLGVSVETIKTHLKSLFRKLVVSDRAEAVKESLRRGLILEE